MFGKDPTASERKLLENMKILEKNRVVNGAQEKLMYTGDPTNLFCLIL